MASTQAATERSTVGRGVTLSRHTTGDRSPPMGCTQPVSCPKAMRQAG